MEMMAGCGEDEEDGRGKGRTRRDEGMKTEDKHRLVSTIQDASRVQLTRHVVLQTVLQDTGTLKERNI